MSSAAPLPGASDGSGLRQDLATGRLPARTICSLKATDAANEAIRSLIREMRESSLGTRGLAQTLELLVSSLRAVTEAQFDVQVEEVGGSPMTQLLIYQIAREALGNAARHSGAARISLFLGVRDGAVRLVVQDDGNGFSALDTHREGHFGIHLMRERAELAGGTILIESAPGRGTVVVARVPWTSLSHRTRPRPKSRPSREEASPLALPAPVGSPGNRQGEERA
jgi:nitrate/nitrite-specific signal transduction histidine kinase